MADQEKNHGGPEAMTSSAENEFHPGRRRALKIGAVLVPMIITLKATPAWAQTDYTMVAYRYGTNAGLCRNENYNPNANPNSHAGQEFVECPRGSGRDHDSSQDQPQGPGPVGY